MYSMLMVYLDPFADNAGLLQITGELADRFHAGVLGVSASQLVGVGGNLSEVSGGVVDRGRQELDDALEANRHAFDTALQRPGRQLEWRAIVSRCRLETVVIRHARSADMVIVAASYPESLAKGTPYLNTGDLVMQAGRPVLIVPPTATSLPARNILVAWKDTRESRRAVSDAMPMLQAAERTLVVEIARDKRMTEANESVGDVVRWLTAHGVKAEGRAVIEQGLNAPQLKGIIKTEGADLVVAGAYHHRRFLEWALGGVTRKLLLSGDMGVLVSH